MRIIPFDPLKLMAAAAGMRRAFDRNDFPGGHVPEWAMRNPNPGIIDRLDAQWGGHGFDNYEAFCSNLGLLTGDDASAQDMFGTAITKPYHPFGQIGMSRDGRIFRYASAGATDLVVGNIIQSAAPIPNHLALTSAAQNIGDGGAGAPIVVTPGATAGAANLYAEGTLMIDTTPGNGYTYRINGHLAITASTAFNLLLDPDDRIQVALTTSSRYGLHHNPYKTVIVSATTATAFTCGGCNAIITGNGTAENYGWLQTRGPFAGLINGTPAVGTGLVISATTAGALDVAAVAAEINVRIIARAMQVGVSTKNNAVFLLLD